MDRACGGEHAPKKLVNPNHFDNDFFLTGSQLVRIIICMRSRRELLGNGM